MASVVASTTVKKENVTSGKSVEPVYSASSTSSVKMSSNETSKEEILQIKVLISIIHISLMLLEYIYQDFYCLEKHRRLIE